jgi:uncharacterized membrane protein
MTAEAPIDVVVAAFPTEQGAKDTLHDLDQAKKDGLINIKDAAVLRKDQQSKLHISETADKGFGRGAMIGGVAGAAVGLLAGPIGWGLLGGAAVGGLAAKLRDGGFPDQRLRQIGEGLRPDSSAIVAVIEHTWVRDVERMMMERGADLATEQVASEIAAQLDADAERAQQQGGTGTGTPSSGTP